MNTAFVITDSHEGSIRRYEDRDGVVTKTHKADVEGDWELPVTFGVEMVRGWLRHAPGEFYCLSPAPIPGTDDPSGGAPAAIAA